MPRNEVKVKVTADTAQAEAAVGGLGSKMGGILKAGAIAAGVAVIGLGAASLSMGANFQTAFAEVTTLFPATEAQIDSLRDGVRNLSREMGIDATEATGALYTAISKGVPPDNAIAFLRENVKLSVAGVTELETAVSLTSGAIKAFGLTGNDLQRVSDALFTTVQLGGTTIDELAAAMFNVAPAAGAAGLSIEQIGASLAVLTANMIPTNVATTSLRQGVAELGKAGTVAAKNFQDIAGIGFRDFIAKGGDMAGAMELLKQKAEEDGVAVSDLFGSIEAGLSIQVLATTGFKDLEAALAAMDENAGATQTAYEKMNETFERQFSILKENLKFVMMDMSLAVLPALTEAVKFLALAFQITTEVIGTAVAFLKENRLVAIGLAAAVATLLAPAFIALTGTILTATAATVAFIAAQLVAAAPLILLAAAVAALVVGIILLVENWDLVTRKVEQVMDGLQRVPGQLLDLGRSMGIELGRGLASAGRSIWEVAKSIVRGIITILNPFNWVFGSTMTEVYARQGGEAGAALVGSLEAAFGRLSGVTAPLLEPLKEVRDFIGGLQSEMARLLGLGTVQGTDEQLRLAELRLALIEKEGSAEQELERIQRDRLERLAPLEERLAEARGNQSPSGLINLLERQIQAISDEETAIERDIRVLKEQIETIQQATEVRRLETEILGLRGKAADATLLTDAELVTAAEKMIEAIARETETFSADAALIHTTFIPALKDAGAAEGELGGATAGLISGEGGLEDLQKALDDLTAEPFELEMFDAGQAVEDFKEKAKAELGKLLEEFKLWAQDIIDDLDEWGINVENIALLIGGLFLPGLMGALIAKKPKFLTDLWQLGRDAAASFARGLLDTELGGGLSVGDILKGVPGGPLIGPALGILGFHQGGVVPGIPGTERLIVAQAGEVVQTADEAQFDDDRGAGSGGGIVIHELHLHGPLREALADLGLEVR